MSTAPLQELPPALDEDLAIRCHETTVLITAPLAADVEQLAWRIHTAGGRNAFPFVHRAARQLPPDPVALFTTCARLLLVAAGGTLLLTDVEHMPTRAQDRIIETLQPMLAGAGASRGVRLIAGTTTSLCELTAEGSFSARLFYRLNIIHLVVKADEAPTSS